MYGVMGYREHNTTHRTLHTHIKHTLSDVKLEKTLASFSTAAAAAAGGANKARTSATVQDKTEKSPADTSRPRSTQAPSFSRCKGRGPGGGGA